MNKTYSNTLELIKEAINNANGKRHTRTLTVADVVDAIKEAQQDGFAFRHGGNVANKYGYAAVKTVAFAAKADDGAIALAIGVNNACNGSARPAWLAEYVPAITNTPKCRESVRQWANLPTTGYGENGGYLLILASEVPALLA